MEHVRNFNPVAWWEGCQSRTKNKVGVAFCAFFVAYVVTAVATGSMNFPVHFGVSVGAGVVAAATACAVGAAWKKHRDGNREERQPLVRRHPDDAPEGIEMGAQPASSTY
jgi:hypothetical protein